MLVTAPEEPGSPPSEEHLRDIAARLVEVPGVVGVVLGGSRARGDDGPGSDTDLGIVYRDPLDLDALRSLAREVGGPTATLTAPGGWGPWVDGGGWLTVDGAAVDWIYRELDRVRASWDAAQRGEVTWHVQAGHPLGVPGFAYAGEIALARVLADPGGALTALHEAAAVVPPALAAALVEGLWEASFLLAGARKGARRGDAAYVSGCLFRTLGLCAHAIHARAGRWLVNEKGAVAQAGRLPGAPAGFADRAQGLVGRLGDDPAGLLRLLDDADALVREVATG